MTPHQHAEALVRCFAGYVAKEDDMANREHLRIASEWLRLLNADDPEPAELEAILKDVDGLEDVGSATLDLRIVVRAWASRARRRAIARRLGTG
jgi:hypothetical protein